ncbi:MAG: CapA family protein [Anaerolineaceae bacterium]|nr:CapA family protein [Anaerolineaceae bacterium]
MIRKLIYLFFLFVSFSPAAADHTIYALACPFKTLTDEITKEQLVKAASADPQRTGEIKEIYISAEVKNTFPELFGVVTEVEAPEKRIEEKVPFVSCAVIPVDELDPMMKYIRIESEKYPWDRDYNPENDVLAVKSEKGNFDKDKLTTLLLTGTTALARTTSYKMYLNGALYPGELIKPVFDESDITHISNESSIWSLCPDPINTNGTMQFCTQQNAYELFDYLGVDVIELTGNHLRDYDWKPLLEMLNEFDERNYKYYASGRTYEEADMPLFVKHNGNSFVFLGCNAAGPEHVYVDDTRPGVNRCDFDKMEEEIKRFSREGYIVIATIQYYETYSRVPSSMQEREFKRLSAAGAAVVSGSQAHYSQTFLPMEDRFIHYGLGNLFFDQMDTPVEGTRQEFLDKYIFYDGRLLNVQVITALLTDYARPRLMIESERSNFLREIFGKM